MQSHRCTCCTSIYRALHCSETGLSCAPSTTPIPPYDPHSPVLTEPSKVTLPNVPKGTSSTGPLGRAHRRYAAVRQFAPSSYPLHTENSPRPVPSRSPWMPDPALSNRPSSPLCPPKQCPPLVRWRPHNCPVGNASKFSQMEPPVHTHGTAPRDAIAFSSHGPQVLT